jgi:hypothetical protein
MRRIQKAFAAQNRLWFLTRFLLSKEKKGGDHTADRPQFFTSRDPSVLWTMPLSGIVPDSHFPRSA